MTKEEFIAKIQKYEWKDIECKKAQKGVPEDAYKTVSAFANTAGGRLVFGVEDKKGKLEIVGVLEVDKVQNDFLSTLRARDKLNRIIAVNEDLLEHDDKTLLVFHVPESSRHEKPVYLKGDLRQTYIRRGSGDEKCTPTEIECFLRDASTTRYDNEALEFLSASTFFEENDVNWYRQVFKQKQHERHATLNNVEFLNEWGFVVEIEEKLVPTRAAVLLFGKGKYVRQVLPRGVVDYQRIDTDFDNWSPEKRWNDRIVFEENIIQTWLGLVEKYMRLAEHPFALDSATLRRDDVPPDYISFREAAINLLIHQDYGDHSRKPVIKFFKDRTQFWNPGDAFATDSQLLEPVEKEVRNPSIVNAFRRIGLSDQAGTGIRSIFSNWRQIGNVPPQVKNNKAEKTFELILLKEELLTEEQILFQSSLGVHLSEDEAAVFAYACNERNLRLLDVKAITGKTASECRGVIERLKTQMLLRQQDEDLFELAEHLQSRFSSTQNADSSQESAESDNGTVETVQNNNIAEHVDSSKQNLSTLTGTQVNKLSSVQYKILNMCEVPRSLSELQEKTDFGSRGYFKRHFINPLMDAGLLRMTNPEKPRARNQKYVLTDNGLQLVLKHRKSEQVK